MIRRLIIVATLLMAPASWGDVGLKTLSSKSFNAIRIVAPKGQVILSGSSEGLTQIVVPNSASTAQWAERTEGRTIIFEYVGPKTEAASIGVSGGILNAEVFLGEGSLQAKNWGNLMFVTQKGKLQSFEGRGSLKSNVQEGEIEIGGQVGEVQLESFDSKTVLRSITGPVKLVLHSGQCQAESLKGPILLEGQRARFQIAGGEGDLKFENRQGAVLVVGWTGSIDGISEQGPVTLRLTDTVNVKVQTKEGPVDLHVPQKSAAGVAFDSVEGRVLVPKYLKVGPYFTGAQARGKLQGEVPGRLQVKTQTGRISLKVQ